MRLRSPREPRGDARGMLPFRRHPGKGRQDMSEATDGERVLEGRTALVTGVSSGLG